MTRREWIALMGAAPMLKAAPSAPAAPVSIAKCASYDEDVTGRLSAMFAQLGGLERLVKNKTVTVKLNMTGGPARRYQGLPPGNTHFTHPNLIGAVTHLLGQAGARRVRRVESAGNFFGPLEEHLLDSGWNVRSLQSAAPRVEFENTVNLGLGKSYSRFAVPGGGTIFPAFDLNHSYQDTDVFVSMAKLKQHEICGVTLSMKNCFGITPASIYGEDAGRDEPNESPMQGRASTCHLGKRQPSKSAPQERDPASSRDPGYRMPRVVVDLVTLRPIDLAIIDGVESVAGGEGPWIRGSHVVKPGVLIVGTNPVCTDTVATAVMGFDPRASRGAAPFPASDNTLLLAEERGLGAADLKRIEVRGVSIADALYRFQA